MTHSPSQDQILQKLNESLHFFLELKEKLSTQLLLEYSSKKEGAINVPKNTINTLLREHETRLFTAQESIDCLLDKMEQSIERHQNDVPWLSTLFQNLREIQKSHGGTNALYAWHARLTIIKNRVELITRQIA